MICSLSKLGIFKATLETHFDCTEVAVVADKTDEGKETIGGELL